MITVATVEGIKVSAVDDQELESVDLHRWAKLMADGLCHEGVAGNAEAGLTFVDPESIAQLKVEHLDGDGDPTDVLAFPIDDAAPLGSEIPRLVGDIVICPAVARANQNGLSAAELPASGESFANELALLVVHGLLHLLGHDHRDASEETAMRKRETALIRRFHCDEYGGRP